MPPPSISLGSSVRTLKEATRQQQADELRAAARLHRPARNLTTATARGKTESLNMARNLLFFVLGLALIVYLRMTLPPAEDAVVADDRECVARTADPEKITRVGFQSNNVFTMSPLYLHPSEAPLYVGGGVLPDFLDRCGARATVYACAASARVVPFLSERNSAARLWPLCCCCRPPPLSPLFSPLTLLLRSLSFSFGNFTRAGMADAIRQVGHCKIFLETATTLHYVADSHHAL